jgi:hypothetical protein
MRNTANVGIGKLFDNYPQSVSNMSAINHLVASYEIHGRKGEFTS